jgi:hypothetical protein
MVVQKLYKNSYLICALYVGVFTILKILRIGMAKI